ncbi:MAG: molybdopterin-dependent oxidoreductase, partial [Planctomycetes bacterium]|nr:molybdopterin-dependent oxidoreductase [Planctomycetota bacterium]
AQTASYGSVPIAEEPICKPSFNDTDYSNWIIIDPGNKVRVFTGRTELGQGLKTVITATVTQGLDIPMEALSVIQGDTDQCPNDGATNGSAACLIVGWGFWLACQKIQGNIITRASKRLGIAANELRYRSGGVGLKGSRDTLIKTSDLGDDGAVIIRVDPTTNIAGKQYTDRKILNVNGKKIVTGSLEYVADLKVPGTLYAGFLTQPYHQYITRLESFNAEKAKSLPGIRAIEVVNTRVAVVGERYTDVLNALSKIDATWRTPNRPRELHIEEEARAEAELEEVKEQQGDVESGFASSNLVLSETYYTQYSAHGAIETDTSLAIYDSSTGKCTAWASTQWPHLQRERIAYRLKVEESDVRVISQPAGGAFGGKIGNTVNEEAASLSSKVNAPVKLVYSRKDQFQLRSHFKAAVVIDITTGINSDGKMISRKIDSFEDLAEGSTFVYDIPNTLTRAFKGKLPYSRAVVRGTSFVQTCFAIESHVDMLAQRLGIDPLDFRRQNVQYPAFINLIDDCAERIGYTQGDLGPDEGIGLAMVKHGGAQLGVVAARVAVNRDTGK